MLADWPAKDLSMTITTSSWMKDFMVSSLLQALRPMRPIPSDVVDFASAVLPMDLQGLPSGRIPDHPTMLLSNSSLSCDPTTTMMIEDKNERCCKTEVCLLALCRLVAWSSCRVECVCPGSKVPLDDQIHVWDMLADWPAKDLSMTITTSSWMKDFMVSSLLQALRPMRPIPSDVVDFASAVLPMDLQGLPSGRIPDHPTMLLSNSSLSCDPTTTMMIEVCDQ
nr:hypothetical protein CFP56_74698 [Quercus suber]